MARAEHEEVDEPMAMTNKALRTLAIIASLAMIAFWAWIFAGGPKKTNPDYLDDRSYVTFAKTRCDEMVEGIAALPNAREAASADDRADTLVQANKLVATMIDDLTARAPKTGKDKVRLDGWLKDWRTYLADRERYVDTLRKDPEAQINFTEHEDFREGVDGTIRTFADVNNMRECRTPGDVG